MLTFICQNSDLIGDLLRSLQPMKSVIATEVTTQPSTLCGMVKYMYSKYQLWGLEIIINGDGGYSLLALLAAYR